jgi:phenylacetate-CoA ligase
MKTIYYYNISPSVVKKLVNFSVNKINRLKWQPTENEIIYLNQLNSYEYCSSLELMNLQNRKLSKLVHYAVGNVAYYRNLFEELGLVPNDIRSSDDLIKLPILKKETIRENPSLFISNEFKNRSDLIKISTGGSTGTPMQYFFDSHMIGVRRATWSRWAKFADIDLYNGKMIYCGGAPKKWVYSKEEHRGILSLDGKRLDLSSALMSDEVLERYIADINKFKGDFLRGYASGTYILARKILSMNENIKLKAVLTSSDTLFPQYRHTIEKAFKCKVYDHYGQNEDILTATECEFNAGYHINVESTIAETVDDSNCRNIGDMGKLIGTHLENYVMPLIRYEVGDVGILDKNWTKCECGRSHQKILKLIGRDDEIIITKSGRKIGGAFLNQPMKEMTNKIVESQYIQESPTSLLVKIVPTLNWSYEKDHLSLKNNLINLIGDELDIKIEIVETIPRRDNGKYKFIESRL